MKFSNIAMVAFCGALAFAFSGCKYDRSGEGGDASGSDVSTIDNGGAGGAVGNDIDTISGGDGVPATELKFDQDPNYVRCTDVDFQPVYFGFDASNLAGSEMSKVEAVASHLQSHPTRVVIVEGNCDERGSNEYNLSLGELRAISIRDYLVSLGIAPNRVQTKSYGEEKPAVLGSGEAVWSKNRRGEFAIFQHR